MSAKNSVSVTLQGVTKRFKNTKGRSDVVAVRESNFTVAPGELVTLLGPSGCGKTTTLRMIGGFELFRNFEQFRMLVFGAAMVGIMVWGLIPAVQRLFKGFLNPAAR